VIAWFESLPTMAAGIAIVGGFVAVSLLIGYVVSKATSEEVRAAHTDRAGFILAVIGVIYAVLLAFVAIGVWERFQQAEARSYDEAAAISTLYRDADSFPQGKDLRRLLRAYALSVANVEWARMRSGERAPLSDALLDSVDRGIRNLSVNSPSRQNVQADMLSAMNTAMLDRQTRLTVDFVGINGIMWVVLIIGAFVTVAFTYLFGFEKTIMQQLMIGGLSLLVGLVIFLILALDYPYRGSIAVQPEAFRVLLESFSR